jgi:proline iminopeptidase
MKRFVADTMRLKGELPQSVQDTIDYHEDNELYMCPEYQGAIAIWYQTYICRMQPWPKGLEDSFAQVGMDIYMTMVGPSDFKVTGNLKDWDIMDRLGEISVPTLFIAGRYDECTPEHMKLMHDRVPGSEWAYFDNSAHMPFYEEREECMRRIRDFMSRAEESQTR